MSKKIEARSRSPNLHEIRESAKNGAASRLGYDRVDALEEIAAIVMHRWVQAQQGAGRIKNPRSWAFRVGQNEAKTWSSREDKVVPFENSADDDQEHRGTFSVANDLVAAQKPSFQGQDEVLEALPELFEWFYDHVVAELDDQDQHFFKLHYLDRWSEEQLAATFKMTRKSVVQRWGRILIRLRRILRHDLQSWERGHELFGDALAEPKSLMGLLCLMRLYAENGINAIRDIIVALKLG